MDTQKQATRFLLNLFIAIVRMLLFFFIPLAVVIGVATWLDNCGGVGRLVYNVIAFSAGAFLLITGLAIAWPSGKASREVQERSDSPQGSSVSSNKKEVGVLWITKSHNHKTHLTGLP